MTKKDLEKALREAAEIARKLPKNLQETGFNLAVEQLLGKAGSAGSGGRRSQGSDRSKKKSGDAEGQRGSVAKLLDAIDRTAHPDVGATSRVGDRALKVLFLADQNHGIDGLTAGEIAEILSRKFRLPTKPNSVLKALERETDTVDVRSGAGGSRVFHIMAPGETYLERLRAGEEGGRRATTKKARVRKKKAPREKPGKRRATGKKAAGRPGPKAAVGQLLETGFFRSARTISEIQEELQHRRGHGYSVQELSPALVRSVRDQSLARERNAEGHYEYREA